MHQWQHKSRSRFELVVNHEDVYATGALDDEDKVYIESELKLLLLGV